MSKSRPDFFYIFLSILGYTVLRELLKIWIPVDYAQLISFFAAINLMFLIPPQNSWLHLKFGKSVKGIVFLNLAGLVVYIAVLLLSEVFLMIAPQMPQWIIYVLFFFLVLVSIGYGFHLVEKITQK